MTRTPTFSFDGSVLVCTVGLPRSGKTTWCRKFAARHGAPIVCPDDIRLALYGPTRFIARTEKYVWAIVHTMVRALVLSGHKLVILDATNITRKRRREWIEGDALYSTVFHHIDTPMEECLERARSITRSSVNIDLSFVEFSRWRSELILAIKQMALKFEPLDKDDATLVELGETGEFPDGQINEDDEGELRMAMSADPKQKLIHVNFGKPVSYIGLDFPAAVNMGKMLLEKAAEIK